MTLRELAGAHQMIFTLLVLPIQSENNNTTKVMYQTKPCLTRGGCHNVALLFTLKSILRQKKKNYGNSNIYFTM
jgi:hypothetical protein